MMTKQVCDTTHRGWSAARRLALVLALVGPALSTARADDLTYLFHAPTQASPHPPLLVLLHGRGADERDMIGLWHDLPDTLVVVSPRAPFPQGDGYAWYRRKDDKPIAADLALSRKIVDAIVDNAIARFDVDTKRVFIGGFSQGAVMVYEVVLREPGKFRGAAVLSGSIFASEIAALSATTDRSQEAFFVGHGTADPLIPFAAATAARDDLARLGVPAAFHSYPGMGHGIGPDETRDLAAWLVARGAGAAQP